MMHRQRLSILYLDDEAPCLDIFRQMFGHDHDVRTALTVGEARRALADCSFDIVLSDYRMPETSGSDFLQEVASAQPDCFRVMLTGAAGVGGFIGELGAGVIQLFLKKPWSEESMRMALELTGVARALSLRPSGATRGHDSDRISTPKGA